MPREDVQAYAKIVGPGWQYYMTKSKIILGRGGKGVPCDVQLSGENAVSRQHFSIRFAPEHQALEVENLSKNGILVNGIFIQKYGKPVLLKSQAEIAYGRYDTTRITLILPMSNRNHMSANKKQQHDGFRYLDWIGHALVNINNGYGATMNEIIAHLRSTNRQQLKQFNDTVLINSVRAIITQNDRFFEIILPKPEDKDPTVRFAVMENARDRFMQFAKIVHAQRSANGNTNVVGSTAVG